MINGKEIKLGKNNMINNYGDVRKLSLKTWILNKGNNQVREMSLRISEINEHSR